MKTGSPEKTIFPTLDMPRAHERLIAWQQARMLVKDIYVLTRRLPDTERFGLTSQVRRSAVSIAANVAEGAARKTESEFAQFLYIARGSLSELETELILAADLELLDPGKHILERIERLHALLNGLINAKRKQILMKRKTRT